MKGILIDPWEKRVSSIEVDKGLGALYDAMDCSCVTTPISFENRDSLFMDDEGRFRDNAFWEFEDPRGQVWQFVGKGLILGTDEEGDSESARSELEDIKERCTFTPFLLRATN